MGSAPYVFQRPGRKGYYIQLRAGGERKIVRAGDTQKQAEQVAQTAAALRDTGNDIESILDAVLPGRRGASKRKERLSFRNASTRYLTSVERRLRDSTFRARVQTLKRVGKAAWASRRLDGITSPMLHKWAESRREEGVGPCGINRELSAISCVFHWAESIGIIDANPARSAQVRRDREPSRDLWYDPDEAEYLFSVADEHLPDFSPALRILFWTGLRRGELAKLEWRDVDITAGTVTVRAEISKNGKPRTFELNPDALALVKALPSRFKGGTVMLRADGGHFTDNAYAGRVRLLRKHATGLPAHKREFRLHALRHSHCTLLAAQGVPLESIAQSVGQSSTSVTSLYCHATPQARRAVAEAGAVVFKPTTKATKAAK